MILRCAAVGNRLPVSQAETASLRTPQRSATELCVILAAFLAVRSQLPYRSAVALTLAPCRQNMITISRPPHFRKPSAKIVVPHIDTPQRCGIIATR